MKSAQLNMFIFKVSRLKKERLLVFKLNFDHQDLTANKSVITYFIPSKFLVYVIVFSNCFVQFEKK